MTAPTGLTAHESIALTVALAQLHRGDAVTPNVAEVCILALGRAAGRVRYDAGKCTYSVAAPGGVGDRT